MIDGKTKFSAVIGDPVEHSISPFLHNSIAEETGLNYGNVAFRVDKTQLESAVRGAKAFGLLGLAVTIPHKVEIMKYLDGIDDSAKSVGAVNVVKIEDGKALGFNTDGKACLLPLKKAGGDIRNKNVAVIGAGGASRAIVFEILKEKPAELVIVNRTLANAEKIAKDVLAKISVKIGCAGNDERKKVFSGMNLIINTTSVGMSPDIDSTPVFRDEMPENCFVYDIIYNPMKTKLLKIAESKNNRILNGVGMIVSNAIMAVEMFTGTKSIDYGKLLRKAEEYLMSVDILRE